MVNIEKSYNRGDSYYNMVVKDLSSEDIQDVNSIYTGISEKELEDSIKVTIEHSYTGKPFKSEMVVKKGLLPSVLEGVKKKLEIDEFYEYCYVIYQVIQEYKKCEQTENLYQE